jgi:chemotaxis protein MotB
MSGGHGGKHKRHEEHEEHEEHVNHEAWVIPYADMLTLLMALFLVLFAIGRTDLEKFKKLAEGLNKEFGKSGSEQIVTIGSSSSSGDAPLDGGNGVLANSGTDQPGVQQTEPTDLQIEQARQAKEKADAQAAVDQLQGVEDAIQDAADAEGVGDKIAFRFEGRGLVVTILNQAVLFKAGNDALQPDGQAVLDLVIDSLKQIPNDLAIEGHTDDRPISTNRFPDNLALSSARAESVYRYMRDKGIDPIRLSVSGYGAERPVADNVTVEGQAANRRVEIVIVSDISLAPVVSVDG